MKNNYLGFDLNIDLKEIELILNLSREDLNQLTTGVNKLEYFIYTLSRYMLFVNAEYNFARSEKKTIESQYNKLYNEMLPLSKGNTLTEKKANVKKDLSHLLDAIEEAELGEVKYSNLSDSIIQIIISLKNCRETYKDLIR